MKRKKGNKNSIITFYLFIYTDKLKIFFHPTHIHRQKKNFFSIERITIQVKRAYIYSVSPVTVWEYIEFCSLRPWSLKG